MKTLLQVIILLAPMAIEVPWDFCLWRKGLSDKPLTTLVRSLALIPASAAAIAFLGLNGFIYALVLGYAWYFLAYDYLMGYLKHRDIFYKGDGLYDRFMARIPIEVEFIFKAFIFAAAVAFYLHDADSLLYAIYMWLHNLFM